MPDSSLSPRKSAFNRYVATRYDFTKADVVLSLDADFLSCGPGNLRYVADFMSRRRVRTTATDAGQATMNRLYVVEPGVSTTGAKADHRLALKAAEVEGLALAFAADEFCRRVMPGPRRWVDAVAKDLEQHRGRYVSWLDHGNPRPSICSLYCGANDHLDNVGKTVFYTDPIEPEPVDQLDSLRRLSEDLDKKKVKMLVNLGGNPVFTTPRRFPLRQTNAKVPLRVHQSLYQDETSSASAIGTFQEAHYLESWGDTRAYDGTVSIVQPLIQPLYQGRTFHELLAVLRCIRLPAPAFEIVRDYWSDPLGHRRS